MFQAGKRGAFEISEQESCRNAVCPGSEMSDPEREQRLRFCFLSGVRESEGGGHTSSLLRAGDGRGEGA